MIDLERPQWQSIDATNLRDFLKTETGRKLLGAIALEEPQLLAKGDVNEILVRSGEVRQHKHLLNYLLALTGEGFELEGGDKNPVPENISPNYPPPEDDRFWDGDKLTDSNP